VFKDPVKAGSGVTIDFVLLFKRNEADAALIEGMKPRIKP
jgi:hypothetical protein